MQSIPLKQNMRSKVMNKIKKVMVAICVIGLTMGAAYARPCAPRRVHVRHCAPVRVIHHCRPVVHHYHHHPHYNNCGVGAAVVGGIVGGIVGALVR